MLERRRKELVDKIRETWKAFTPLNDELYKRENREEMERMEKEELEEKRERERIRALTRQIIDGLKKKLDLNGSSETLREKAKGLSKKRDTLEKNEERLRHKIDREYGTEGANKATNELRKVELERIEVVETLRLIIIEMRRRNKPLMKGFKTIFEPREADYIVWLKRKGGKGTKQPKEKPKVTNDVKPGFVRNPNTNRPMKIGSPTYKKIYPNGHPADNAK